MLGMSNPLLISNDTLKFVPVKRNKEWDHRPKSIPEFLVVATIKHPASLFRRSSHQAVRSQIQRGLLCKTTFTSHTLWVSSVKWSDYDEHLFVSGSYDAGVKLWDTRSSKAPLYDLQGHVGQVLAVDWSNRQYLVSGGSDNSVHIFKNKHVI